MFVCAFGSFLWIKQTKRTKRGALAVKPPSKIGIREKAVNHFSVLTCCLRKLRAKCHPCRGPYTCQFQGPAPNRYPQIPPSTRSRVRCCHLPARPRRRTYSPDTGRPSSTLIRVMPNRYPHQGCLKPACQGDPHRWLAGWLLGGPTG